MPTTFAAPDGTEIAYHVLGEGPPLVCLPGGPMRASAYLGDLGGLSAQRQLIMLDLRGTGRSAAPQDPSSYRCDRLVGDVEALRTHLGLDRVDLLGHSVGGSLAAMYAARHPEHVDRLALITPSAVAVDVTITVESRLAAAELHRDEPWFPAAVAALEAIAAGKETDADFEAITPLYYGRWDETARSHSAAEAGQRNARAASAFSAEGAFDPDATRTALAHFEPPVLLLAGEADLATPPPSVAEFAALFPHAEFVTQSGAGHYPWLDDADWFVAAVSAFLGADRG